MLDETHFSEEAISALEQEASDDTNQIIRQVVRRINPYWNVF
jgi:hypothetical protein